MKRILSLSLFAGLVAVLGGCPIYSDNSSDYRVCDGSQCYDCPNNVYSSACVPWQCGTSLDCPSGYYCGGSGSCVSGSGGEDGGFYSTGDDAGSASTCSTPSDCSSGYNCGANGTCDPGDCTTSGCPSGWECVLENGAAVCAQSLSTATDSGSPTTSEDSGGSTSTDAGLACQQSSECVAPDGGGSGSLCLDGTCVAPVNECSDGTQCPSGDKCVQGACTATCGGSVACPTGYACDQTNGVCTGNPAPCESNPSVCASGTVCSQNHCVAPCGTGGTCPSNEQCLQGGCVPDQEPLFTCTTDGSQDNCAPGSVCLHHSCYIACSADAGADASTACQSADQFNQCKPVTTSSGTYDVCGSSTNLGSQCDPTSGLACPNSGVCIDGYCH
jgi:hypothetical protein